MSVSRLQNLTGDLTPIAQQYNRTVACTQAYYVQHYQDPKETSPFPDGCFIVVKDDTQSVMDSFIDQIYPVGTVYMNALVQTDPNVLFNHGTWARITGRFLYAAATTDTLLDIGGASTVTLTQNNLPATATFTIPALSLSIDSASTAHTHTTAQTSATTGNPNAEWDPTFSLTYNDGGGGNVTTLTRAAATSSTPFTPHMTNKDHTHSFTIPALTTGGMSTNETHSHTGSTVEASKTISDFGSGTAFSIIPPYVNLAIWYRAS
jgi:hypothetical protein